MKSRAATETHARVRADTALLFDEESDRVVLVGVEPLVVLAEVFRGDPAAEVFLGHVLVRIGAPAENLRRNAMESVSGSTTCDCARELRVAAA